MFDCHDDLKAYHDQKVTLPKADQDEMRRHRDSNRTRLKNGLAKADKPSVRFFKSQGSYAMKTMKRDPENDYDIDDGVYFHKEDLVGPNGGELSSLQVRQMVRDAVDDGRFGQSPEVRSNCVRVFYRKGYHVDMPVYRRVTDQNGDEFYELASATGWVRSDAREVTDWYEGERNATLSPRRFRRLTRLFKMHAGSRSSWKGRYLSGFGISVLQAERYVHVTDRDDETFYRTMKAVHDRLVWDTVVKHPVTLGTTITSGDPDAKAKKMREKLSKALDDLAPLFRSDCDRKTALRCWDKVFATDFFSLRYEKERSSAVAGTAGLSVGTILGGGQAAAGSVAGSGGGRHA